MKSRNSKYDDSFSRRLQGAGMVTALSAIAMATAFAPAAFAEDSVPQTIQVAHIDSSMSIRGAPETRRHSTGKVTTKVPSFWKGHDDQTDFDRH